MMKFLTYLTSTCTFKKLDDKIKRKKQKKIWSGMGSTPLYKGV